MRSVLSAMMIFFAMLLAAFAPYANAIQGPSSVEKSSTANGLNCNKASDVARSGFKFENWQAIITIASDFQLEVGFLPRFLTCKYDDEGAHWEEDIKEREKSVVTSGLFRANLGSSESIIEIGTQFPPSAESPDPYVTLKYPFDRLFDQTDLDALKDGKTLKRVVYATIETLGTGKMLKPASYDLNATFKASYVVTLTFRNEGSDLPKIASFSVTRK